jgi:hypothetical protein
MKYVEAQACSECGGKFRTVDGECYAIVDGPEPCTCLDADHASDPNVAAASIVNQIANRD